MADKEEVKEELKILKCIDPKARGTWQIPGYKTKFEYKALAGPTSGGFLTPTGVPGFYINKGLTRVWDIEVDGKYWKLWDVEKDDPIMWTEWLHPNICNKLFVDISKFSRLTEAEESD